MDGPFQGMDFLTHSAEGCHIAKLLGCYEQPLFTYIESAVEKKYSTILNIGCAEGYYAVGLARRMPDSKIYAFDSNPKAREICSELAEKNNVSELVTVDALFKSEDFERYSHEIILVICDIEGAERDLFNADVIPALRHADLIIESHECLLPGITQSLISCFKSTHDITVVEDNGQRQLSNPPSWFKKLSHLDQLLAVWEWRTGPTPWLVMQAKQRNLS